MTESVEVSAQAALLASENATVGTVIENKRIVESAAQRPQLSATGRAGAERELRLPSRRPGRLAAGRHSRRPEHLRRRPARQLSTTSRSTASRTPIPTSTPSSCCRRSMRCRSSRCRPASIPPSSAAAHADQRLHQVRQQRLPRHRCSSSSATTSWMRRTMRSPSARPPKDPFKWNQFGFTLGGPVSIPKIFNGRQPLVLHGELRVVPAAPQRAGRLQAAFGRHARRQFLRAAAAARRASSIRAPASTAAAASRGASVSGQHHSRQPHSSDFAEAAGVLPGAQPGPDLHATTSCRRRAARSTATSSSAASISSSPPTRSGSAAIAGATRIRPTEALKLNGAKIITNFKQYMGSNTRVLTAVDGERDPFRLHASSTTRPVPSWRSRATWSANSESPAWPPGPEVQWGIPNVSLSGVYAGFGNDSEGPYENNNSSLQFINNTSWIRGKHTLQVRRRDSRSDRYNQVGNQFARGQFTFTRNATSNLAHIRHHRRSVRRFPAWRDLPVRGRRLDRATHNSASTRFALYVDDTWKISKRLTINLGLRYELRRHGKTRPARLFNGIVPAGHPRCERSGPQPLSRSSCARARPATIPTPASPSVGPTSKCARTARWATAWSASIRTTSRRASASPGRRPTSGSFAPAAAYFYSQDTGNPRFDMARNLAGRCAFNSNTQTPDLNWDNSLASIAGGIANVPTPYTFANPYDRRTPYTMQYMFNVQRELPHQHRARGGLSGQRQPSPGIAARRERGLPACPSRNAGPVARTIRWPVYRSAARPSRSSAGFSLSTTAATATTTRWA